MPFLKSSVWRKSMTYQIGLCDDELYQIKVNGLFLKEIAFKNDMDLEYHGFSDGMQLRKYLANRELDILFMDIDLGNESGVELAAQLSKQYPKMVIAFVTGHREFMEEAFEMDAMGYLVKPYEINRMERVLQKSLLQVSALKQSVREPELIVNDENIRKKIQCKDIIYIQRQQYKSMVVTGQRQYCVYEPITALVERVGEGFIRVNQSEVVNMSYISTIEGNTIKLKNGMEMSMGRTFKKEALQKYFCV